MCRRLNELPAIKRQGRVRRRRSLCLAQGADRPPLRRLRSAGGGRASAAVAEMTAADYIELLAKRGRPAEARGPRSPQIKTPLSCDLRHHRADARRGLDARGLHKKNMLLLAQHSVGNFLDHCGISLPCHASANCRVGFMLMGEAMADKRVLAMARSVAPVVRGDVFSFLPRLTGEVAPGPEGESSQTIF